MNTTFSYGLILIALMTSCSVGPSYTSPSLEVPSQWKNHQNKKCEGYEANQEGELLYLDHWWQVFDDAKLEELESLALENNRDLFVAYERIQEARASMGIAAADFYPQITLNPQTTNTVELIKTFGNGGAGQANTSSPGSLVNAMPNNRIGNAAMAATGSHIFRAHEVLYFLPLNMSYEVDLWGKIRDQYHYAKYSWLAKKKDYEVVMLSLTSNLAIAYYQLRIADAQIDLLLKVLKTRQKAFEINQARYEEELTFYADVSLAGEEVELALSQYEDVIRQRAILEDQIAILMGVPASEFNLEHMPLTGVPPCIPEGIPSEILLRRPDIAEAEYNVRAEHALVKQAYSRFFPSLTLTAAGGFQSPDLKDFLKWISRYWMDGVQVNQVVFDGGKLSYNLKMHMARFQEASGSYQQQVLIAFQEVENALASLNAYAKQYEIAQSTTQWAQKTYQLYLDRYTLGVIYYINVANTERDLLNYQINLNAFQGFQYIATIQLIKALGGGW